MRRRSLSLIEVILAISIASFLFAALFYTQRDIALKTKDLEQAKQLVFRREKFYLRLMPIFTHAEKCIQQETNLVVVYDNGIDPEPAFCGSVVSLLYLEKGCIRLATWGKDDVVRMETLWEGAQKCLFELLDPKGAPLDAKSSLPAKLKITVTEEKGVDTVFPYWTSL